MIQQRTESAVWACLERTSVIRIAFNELDVEN